MPVTSPAEKWVSNLGCMEGKMSTETQGSDASWQDISVREGSSPLSFKPQSFIVNFTQGKWLFFFLPQVNHYMGKAVHTKYKDSLKSEHQYSTWHFASSQFLAELIIKQLLRLSPQRLTTCSLQKHSSVSFTPLSNLSHCVPHNSNFWFIRP